LPRKYNGGEWSPGRFHSFITSVLRAGSRKWPPKYLTLNKAKTEKKTNPATGRLAQHFLCASCKQEFPAKQVQIDHRRPIVDPTKGFTSWDDYIDALFCEEKNLQCLCIECHKKKTLKEKKKK
jgi:5-methylcytosine-specific restriction endonuclease McrA